MSAKKDPHVAPPVMRVAPLGELKVYMVYEHELELLQRGLPNSNDLNFALALIPVGLTLLVTLFGTTIPDDRFFYGFFIVTVIAFLAGTYCLIRWWPNRRAAKEIVNEIKDRMPLQEAIQEDSPANPSNQ